MSKIKSVKICGVEKTLAWGTAELTDRFQAFNTIVFQRTENGCLTIDDSQVKGYYLTTSGREEVSEGLWTCRWGTIGKNITKLDKDTLAVALTSPNEYVRMTEAIRETGKLNGKTELWTVRQDDIKDIGVWSSQGS